MLSQDPDERISVDEIFDYLGLEPIATIPVNMEIDMPEHLSFRSSNEGYDTILFTRPEILSAGDALVYLFNDLNIQFEKMEKKNQKDIQNKNLLTCQYLSYFNSIITTFDAILCVELIILITRGSKIRELNIIPLR